MAHKMVKPRSFLLYILAIISFFFIGITYADIIEAGKNQGLAGGAIVFGYGIISALFSFIISLILAYKLNRKAIISINKILGLVIIVIISYYAWNYYTAIKPNLDEQRQETPKKPKQKTTPNTNPSGAAEPIAMLYKSEIPNPPGLGMFSPNLYQNKNLFFYGNVNLEKSQMDHIPYDSISFKRIENEGIDIASAPSWFAPQHLKLDYGILYFKAISVTEDFVEIETNSFTNKTAYVLKSSGELIYWPEFLLRINSVESINSETHKVYAKPLDYAGEVAISYSFMKPIKIQQNWMHVHLLDDNIEKVGQGWIKWKENGDLLIKYSLLS